MKKIAIVDENQDCLGVKGGNLRPDVLKKQVQCFSKAAGLLSYLKQLKQEGMVDKFPDYVLIDIYLPDMDAITFLNSFEELVTNVEMPEVFILSSSGSKKSRDLAMQYPFVSAYLKKPVSADLIEVLIAGRSVDDSPH